MTERTKILVCGATGFIGRNLVEHFARKYEYDIRAVEHQSPRFEYPGVEWVKADLTRQEDANRVIRGIDIVIQAAATTSGVADIINRPYIHTTDNAVMNSHIFRAVHKHNIHHLIFFSCTAMYPSSKEALRENDFNGDIPPQYFGVGWTKIYLEKMAEFYSSLGSSKFTVLRHSNISGPHDKYDFERSHMFGATVSKIMTTQDGKIVVWGQGKEARDLLYVDDLMHSVELSILQQRGSFGLYNIGYGTAFPIKEVVKHIVIASNKNIEIKYDKSKPTINTSIFLDCTKAGDEIGWKPKIGFKDGVKRTLDWYSKNL